MTKYRFLFLALQMAIAAVAHVFVFSAEPYRYLLASEYRKVTTEKIKEAVTIEGDKGKTVKLEKTETQLVAPGTSITESVQDIVVEGGQHVSTHSLLTGTCSVKSIYLSFKTLTSRLSRMLY